MISFDYQQVSKEIDSKILHIIQYDDFPDMDGLPCLICNYLMILLISLFESNLPVTDELSKK